MEVLRSKFLLETRLESEFFDQLSRVAGSKFMI